MTYRDAQRLADILAAIDAIRPHTDRGDLADGLIFDAVRIRLLEIGEAVKSLPGDLLDAEPTIPWSQVARMRDHLAHRSFDTTHAVVRATVDNDLTELHAAALHPRRTLRSRNGRMTRKHTAAAEKPRPRAVMFPVLRQAAGSVGGTRLRAALRDRASCARRSWRWTASWARLGAWLSPSACSSTPGPTTS